MFGQNEQFITDVFEPRKSRRSADSEALNFREGRSGGAFARTYTTIVRVEVSKHFARGNTRPAFSQFESLQIRGLVK